MVPVLLGAFVFRAWKSGDSPLAALDVLRDVHAKGQRNLPPRAPTAFLKPAWRKIVGRRGTKRPLRIPTAGGRCAGGVTEAIITAEGLSISPIRANPTDEIDEIARRLYGMLPRLRITELLADSSGDRLDKDPAVEYRDARLLPDASGEPSRRPKLRLFDGADSCPRRDRVRANLVRTPPQSGLIFSVQSIQSRFPKVIQFTAFV